MLLNNSIFYSLIKYFINLSTKLHQKKSLFGALLLVLVTVQCISGIMLSFSYISDPMLVPHVRNEEDMNDLYTDDFFWIHERLVDIIFFTMYCHMYKKINYVVYTELNLNAWLSGSTLWLLMHISIFLGLCLCCTHLSDITLTIAANIIYTICFKTGKVYWVIFTDQTLNADTITRLAYAHYVVSLIILFYSFFHASEMHYDWKNHNSQDGVKLTLNWFIHVLKNELSFLFEWLFYIYIYGKVFYYINEILSYEIFMWGDVGLMTEVRFLGVSPHWYFRGYMGWLIVCPHHYIGIYGLIYYMVIIYFQMYLKKSFSSQNTVFNKANNTDKNIFYYIGFLFMLSAVCYASSLLPYGKFFNRIFGNFVLLQCYFYIFYYLSYTNNLLGLLFSKYLSLL